MHNDGIFHYHLGKHDITTCGPTSRDYASSVDVRCLCGSYFSSDDLHEHYNQCRREKVSAWQRFPPPYDVQGADVVLRPKVLFARNMLPPIPGKNASPATVNHFNRTSKELFLAQSVACDRCGQVFTPDQMSDFKTHTMSCDRSRTSRDRSTRGR